MLWRLDEIKIRAKEDLNGKHMLIAKIFDGQIFTKWNVNRICEFRQESETIRWLYWNSSQ